MNNESQEPVLEFSMIFVITLVVAAVVSYLYSLIVHKAGAVDWDHSFFLAIVMAFLLPWLNARSQKRLPE